MNEPLRYRILRSRLFMVFALIVLVGIIFALVRIALKKYEARQEIEALQTEIEQIKSDNKRLSNLLGYYETDFYQEKMLRKDMGLQKAGEEVIALPDNKGESDFSREISVSLEDESFFKKTNVYKWWEYLFVN